MAIGLTPQAARLLRFLEATPYMPTYQEMADHLGFKSRSRTFYLAEQLIERGWLRKTAKGRLRFARRKNPTSLRVIYGPGHFADRARIKRAETASEQQRVT